MNQQFNQFYNVQQNMQSNTSHNLTAEQIAACQKQQQAYMQQQQQYLLQQQQLQKEYMREEQRNRLKNMNVRTMGTPTKQQLTSNFHQPTPPANGQFVSSSCSPSSNMYNNQSQVMQPAGTFSTQPMQNQPHSNFANGANPQFIMNQSYMVPQQQLPQTAQQFSYNSVSLPPNPIVSNHQPTNSSNQSSSISSDFCTSVFNSTAEQQPSCSNTSNTGQQTFSTSNPISSIPLGGTNIDENDDFGDFSCVVTSSTLPSDLVNVSPCQIGSVTNTTRTENIFSVMDSNSTSESFGSFAAANPSKPSKNLIETSLTDSMSSQITNVSESFGSFAAATNVDDGAATDLDNNDIFGDFKAFATPSNTTIESNAINNLVAVEPVQLTPTSNTTEYIPGSLKDDSADVIHSVAMFSNPIMADDHVPKSSLSEFDKLIEKSLSGSISKSDPKSLFKPAAKPSIPSVKSNIQESVQSANWGALDVGDLFQTSLPSGEQDDFGDFGDFATSGKIEPQIKPIFTISPIMSPVQPVPDLLAAFDFPSSPPSILTGPLTTTTSNTNPGQLLDGFDFTSPASCGKENVDDWSDFMTETVSFQELVQSDNVIPFPVDKANTNLKSKEKIDDIVLSKYPAIYRKIVDFCNTPSGIIDVGRVYEIMVTEKFKLTDLQPLMKQCNMTTSPSAKDLIDLIGIVGMRQKGFPTPSKYELNYRKMPIPSINSAVLREKTNVNPVSSKPQTLLSFVTNEVKNKEPQLKSVFDFGSSSNKVDFSSKPIISSDSLANVTSNTPVSNVLDDDDWGDFSATRSNGNSNTDNVSHNFFFDEPKKSISNMPVLPIPPRKSAPKPLNSVILSSANLGFRPGPPKLDEPPPLSDEDDDAWADFSHPAHKWDIDHDRIEEESQDNVAMKHRWGTVSTAMSADETAADIGDKDYSHIDVDIPDIKPSSTPCEDNTASSGGQLNSLETTNNPETDFVAKFDRVLSFDHEERSITPTAKPIASTDFSFSMESEEPAGSVTTEKGEVNVEKSNSHNKLDRLISNSSLDDSRTPNDDFFSPFADFNSASESKGTDFDDFSDFQSGAVETETSESTDDVQSSLSLKHLPEKDLDGFWNDMVDSLGPKVSDKPSAVHNENVIPMFDFSEPEPVIEKPVSYDALKDEDLAPLSEDKLGAWSKSLSIVLTLLIQCQTIFTSALTSKSSSIINEVVKSDKGGQYLKCCTEVFRVACRISVSGCAEDGVVEIFKEIKHTWTKLAEMLDEYYDMPTVHDFNIHRNDESIVNSERNCGICILDTGSEIKSNTLVYNGVNYHTTCANFWLNTVNATLPNLNPKLSVPLL